MHIVFISYWGINEGLTQATVVPHLRILLEKKDVTRISLITIEREEASVELGLPGIEHHPLFSSPKWSKKLFDKRKATGKLEELHAAKPIDLVMARASLAGWLALRFCERHHVPYTVESFEPHADYMLEAGVWTKFDPRYRLMRLAEKRIKERAMFLLPLTMRYAEYLIEEHGVQPARLLVMPCCVDQDLFQFNLENRDRLREEFKFGKDALMGIYTGKYGGIYLSEEAIDLFKKAKKHWGPRFRLLILSPHQDAWKHALVEAGFKEIEFRVDQVPHNEVPQYCSAADFAFSLHKPTSSKMGISPIKNGEFFACGLPVIMPNGIGDDSMEVTGRKLGQTFDLPLLDATKLFEDIDAILSEDRHRERIAAWADQKRSFDIVRNHYDKILASLG